MRHARRPYCLPVEAFRDRKGLRETPRKNSFENVIDKTFLW